MRASEERIEKFTFQYFPNDAHCGGAALGAGSDFVAHCGGAALGAYRDYNEKAGGWQYLNGSINGSK